MARSDAAQMSDKMIKDMKDRNDNAREQAKNALGK